MILGIYCKLKTAYKLHRFRKLAVTGSDFQVKHCSNCYADSPGKIKIGNHCEIAGSLISQDDGRITIGDCTMIRENSIIGSICNVTIGSYVIISNNIHIYDNNNHPTDPSIRKEMCKQDFHGDCWRWKYSAFSPVVIQDNVFIGERSTILKGVTIGEGAIVASNSVVTKDVPPYTIVAGNPAKVVKKIWPCKR